MTIFAPPCSLIRRVGVMLYDALLLIAIILLGSLPMVALYEIIMGEPYEGGILLWLYLLGLGYLYFAWFWTHGGQTLGMRTWRVVIIRDDSGRRPSWGDCLIRYGVALLSWSILAAGFVWSLFDREKRAWHDIASGTSLVVLPRAMPSDGTSEGDERNAGE